MVDQNKSIRVLYYSKNIGVPTLTFIFNEIEKLQSSPKFIIKVVSENYVNRKKFIVKNISLINPIKRSYFFNKIWWFLYFNNIRLNYYDKVYNSKLNDIIDDFKPDIIHSQFGDDSLLLWDNLNNKRIPFFVHFHGYDASFKLEKRKIYRRRIKDLLLRKNVYPLFVSNYLYNNVKKYEIISQNSELLFCGTDIDKFKRKQTVNNRCRFLQISSLVEKKGHIYTLQAFSIFLKNVNYNSNFSLTLTGDGYNLKNLKKIAEDLNISKFVNFIGWVDVSTAIELLNNSDYFVHHSVTSSNGDTEGLPTSIIEAMAMDMPVISTYHAGIPELVEHNVNGYLVKEKDVKSFANYMEQITSWDYIPENRKKVEKHFSKDSHFKKLSKLYKKSVNY